MRNEKVVIAKAQDVAVDVRGERSGRALHTGDEIAADDGDLVVTIRSRRAHVPSVAVGLVRVIV